MTSKKALLAWRRRMDLSTRKAAQALGCARRSIQHWENEENPLTPPLYILLAAAALEAELTPVKSPV